MREWKLSVAILFLGVGFALGSACVEPAKAAGISTFVQKLVHDLKPEERAIASSEGRAGARLESVETADEFCRFMAAGMGDPKISRVVFEDLAEVSRLKRSGRHPSLPFVALPFAATLDREDQIERAVAQSLAGIPSTSLTGTQRNLLLHSLHDLVDSALGDVPLKAFESQNSLTEALVAAIKKKAIAEEVTVKLPYSFNLSTGKLSLPWTWTTGRLEVKAGEVNIYAIATAVAVAIVGVCKFSNCSSTTAAAEEQVRRSTLRGENYSRRKFRDFVDWATLDASGEAW